MSVTDGTMSSLSGATPRSEDATYSPFLRRRRLAALGAGVIAAGATSTPAPVAVPQTASPNVALGALADLLPPPSVGSQALLAIGDAIAFGAGVAVAPAVAVRGALPPLPLVPPNVQLSLLTGTPNLGAGNNGNSNVGLNNTGSATSGTATSVR
jgi:hypothetical protein